jgi:hypothetical protein
MNTTYVPTYLTSVERDSEGWPKFVTTEQRAWLTAKVQECIERHSQNTIGNIVWWVFRLPDSPRWVVLDAQYAAVHRALLAADCRQVWTK